MENIDFIDGMDESKSIKITLGDSFSHYEIYSVAEGVDIHTKDKINVYYTGNYIERTDLIANKFCVNGDNRYIVIN